MEYDFSGWATVNDKLCSDGRIIRHGAFKDCDGLEVPLVWNHSHNDPENVIGKALLENRDRGVYCYGSFNDTAAGRVSKTLVEHGDIKALSIYANQLKQVSNDVIHGVIREVSLVHAGANPEAFIDTIIAHSDECDEEAIIYSGEDLSLEHSEKKEAETDNKPEGEVKMEKERTVGDVFNEMTEEQQTVVYAMIGQALEDAGVSDNEEDGEVKHNIFENDTDNTVLEHAAMEAILNDGKRCGSLRESFLQHADEYGITNIEYLMPEAQTLTAEPELIGREPSNWVDIVISGVHKSPFAKIKSVFADITEDDARAKGYIKGKLKKEEVFSLLKRTTSPTTVYKKQKMDRDDLIDLKDFNAVAFIKREMRIMLNEELARAYLFGDQRLASSDDHIDTNCIRPAYSDADLYVIKKEVDPNAADFASILIDSCVEAQDDYRGSGNLTAFFESGTVTKMLLLKDGIGHRLYKNLNELAAAMSVDRIVKLPKGIIPAGTHGLVLDLKDYNVGADKGGEINMFDDFDIDYNQQKYLMETRCSGALTKPYSAIVFKTAD